MMRVAQWVSSGAGVVRCVAVFACAAFALSCSNSPYPDRDDDVKILYSVYGEAPKTLDPAVSYNVSSSRIISAICETLLEYHYLKRPYELIPGLAAAIPEPVERADGTVAYPFALREGAMYQDDPAFELGEVGRKTRPVVTADYLFALKRLADPAVNSPVAHIFSKIVGLHAFGERLVERRKEPSFAALPLHEQYEAVGPVEGLVAQGDYAFEVVIDAPYPQMLYWFAMPFTTAVPWEAIAYYDGNEGRPRFADHPVGAGPFRMTHYDKQFRIVLERNPNWYGAMYPEWKAPGAVYPAEGEPADLEKGITSDALAGRQLPFLDRVEFRREKESIPVFNKFLQGYYDKSGINKESFDKVMDGNQLSEDMAAMGIQLDRVVDLAIYYIAFNQADETLGAPAGERGKKLRQAMSLAIDAEEYIELFHNGRGIPAQSVLPPGLFGYDADYRNAYREPDLARARALLEEAGYPEGVDSETGSPLKLRFDTYATNSAQLIPIRYLVDSWRKLGLDVEVESTTYNKFQEKVFNKAHQIFQWGWVADYPDPENFLFLLSSGMAGPGGPNSSNYRNPEYDALFDAMKARPNDEVRAETIREMLSLLEEERVWIELLYRESFVLFHDWISHYKPPGFEFSTLKYQDIDAQARAEWRRENNKPVLWPAYVLLAISIAVIVPGIVTLIRERQ
ncbi:MAG: ABC transporter substrate-binding protein [Myxococcota bacterium]|jgi:ABC-type transport system substrate-binding protein|nr:ABC transporter substrate-binding protein [Myxococcota bacterium]